MDLVRFDPFSMIREFDRMIDRSPDSKMWAPRVDVMNRDEAILIRVDVAGVDPATIDITLEDHTLTISGVRELEGPESDAQFQRREIFAGAFKRTLVLPEGLDSEAITASATNGLLEVSVPRLPEVLPRKVKIDVAG